MGLDFEFDLAGEDMDSIDRGNKLEDGWYHCQLDAVYEDDKTAGAIVFKYLVVGDGRFKGKAIFDRTFDPSNSKDDASEEKTIQRNKMYAGRLGLLTQADCDQQQRKGGSWMDAVGRQFLVRLVTKAKRVQSKTTGKWEDDPGQSFTGPDYAGVVPLDYPKDKLKKLDKNFPWTELGHLLTGPEVSEHGKGGSGGKGGTAATAATSPATTGTAPAPTTNGGAAHVGQRRFSDADL